MKFFIKVTADRHSIVIFDIFAQTIAMKYIPVVLLSLFILTSCSSYQYVTMKSNLPSNESREFIQENDTFQLKYSFSGKNCPLNITILNKQNIPLYIDWQKSSTIVNGKRMNLGDKSSGQFTLIPPRSYIQIIPKKMITRLVRLSPADESGRVSIPAGSGYISIPRYTYQADNTPLSFRCFLVYSSQKDFITENYSDNSFWISDIIPTNTRLKPQTSNTYLKRSSNFTIVASVAILAGVFVIAKDRPAVEK